MSEKEKETIEDCKELVQELKQHKYKFSDFIGRLYYKSKPVEDILSVLLNLIEKQQKELNNIKEIEKSHKEENGKLRVELEKEKERNKKQFETLCRYEDTLGHYECEVFNELGTVINIDKLAELDEIGIMGKRYISKDKIQEMKKYREFELQQEYKEFEEDVEWRTYKKILEV